ncbi:cytochrome P450 9e2-like [Vanessa atalanta]|uniref:cytochrome P450 9e2-like n=1 Tax=Vanessa atalanta TaxID=42275 RepID=UPI001FCD153A|nr:cytochrome P450 9e2-like [Vanessa atalanta]
MELNTGTKELLFFIVENWKLLLFFNLIFFLYFYYTQTFDYFEKRNIKFMKPVIFFGNSLSRITGKRPFIEFQLDVYNYFKGNRYGGYFEGRRPVLYVLDPDLIKSVTISDADHFIDRSTIKTKEPRYLSRSLLALKGMEWKAVRSLITPTFSSSRLKNMFPLVQHCSDQLVGLLSRFDNTEIELKEMTGHFTLEVTGVCAFGISTDALKDENAEFYKVAEKFNYMSIQKRIFFFFILLFMPSMFRYINISFMNYDSTKKLVKILQNTKAERMTAESKRSDFLQLLVDVAIKEKEELENTNESSKRYLDNDTLDAQALLFLLAGFETTSTLLSFVFHTMAVRPDIQDKLRAHIEEITKGQELTYDLLSQLDYLEAVIQETLRMYPPLGRIDRTCTKPYTVPGTSLHLKVGDVVAVPVYGIHMDPDIYPEPKEFIPERFMKEEKKERPSHLFLAFGAGPRNCIGIRFAMIVAKTAIVTLMRNFKFSSGPKTENPVKFHRNSMLLKPESGIWVHVEKI